MNELPINAHISEIGGAHYKVRLEHVPRVGELIDLYSFVDAADGHPPDHWYEVVQVVHKMHDVSDRCYVGKFGSHFVTVYVKKSESEFFDETNRSPLSAAPAVNNSAE